MAMSVSRQWYFTLDFEDAPGDFDTLYFSTLAEALQQAQTAVVGSLAAKGENGDWAALEFDATHAVVWYMGRDRLLRRPYFPHRPAADQVLGERDPRDDVLLGLCSYDERLPHHLTRAEGVRLFAALLRGGTLPAEVPSLHPGQLLLPGMEDFDAGLAAWRAVEWRVHCHASEGR
jgi:hypothetical protein